MCTVLSQPYAIVCRSRTSPQACITCFHAPEVGHHQHHAPMSSSLKTPPSSALTNILVGPSDYPVRPNRNYPTATILHPASCPPRTTVHCLDALCMHDPCHDMLQTPSGLIRTSPSSSRTSIFINLAFRYTIKQSFAPTNHILDATSEKTCSHQTKK